MNKTLTAHAHFSDARTHLLYACNRPIASALTLLNPATDSGAFDALFVLDDAIDALQWAAHESATGLIKTLITDHVTGAASLELERTDTGCTAVAIRHRTGQLLWSRIDADLVDDRDEPAWEDRLQSACAFLKYSVWDEGAPEAVLARTRGDFHEYMTL